MWWWYFKGGASYRLGTAVWAGQPPPFVQHLHQTHDCHLTLSLTDHVQETLRGQKQPCWLQHTHTHTRLDHSAFAASVHLQLRGLVIKVLTEEPNFFSEMCSCLCVIVVMFPNTGGVWPTPTDRHGTLGGVTVGDELIQRHSKGPDIWSQVELALSQTLGSVPGKQSHFYTGTSSSSSSSGGTRLPTYQNTGLSFSSLTV